MPRRRRHRRWQVPLFLDGFPGRLEQFKEASGLTWAELARRVGTNTLTVRRWRAGAHPNSQHLLALMDLAGRLGLGHILTAKRPPDNPNANFLSVAGQKGGREQVHQGFHGVDTPSPRGRE